MRDRSGFGWLALIVSTSSSPTCRVPESSLLPGGCRRISARRVTLLPEPDSPTIARISPWATGIMDIVFYARVERHTGFGPMTALVSGILSVMCGFMLLVYPSAGQWAMTLLFPLWFLTHCISNLTHLNWVRLVAGRVNYTISLVLNILGIMLATLMLLHPVLSAVSMSLTIGFYLILLGVDGIVLALSGMGR